MIVRSNDDQLESLFRRSAADYRVKPRDASWQRMRKRMNRPSSPMSYWWAVAAALFLGIVALGGLQLMTNKTNDSLAARPDSVQLLDPTQSTDGYFRYTAYRAIEEGDQDAFLWVRYRERPAQLDVAPDYRISEVGL